jgi:uncharacterized membrane protein YoaK (UPF0700 family)
MPLKFKIHWRLNWIVCAIVFVVLAAVFCYRYFTVGVPVEDNWFQEVTKYLFMLIPLTVICWTICYGPFLMLSAYLAKKKEGKIK